MMKKGQSSKLTPAQKAKHRKSQQIYRDKNWEYRLHSACSRHNRSKIYEVTFEKEYLRQLWDDQRGLCFWTQTPMLTCSIYKRHPQLVSIDRIDSEKGYNEDYVVLACTFANFGKSDTDVRTWFTFLQTLKRSMNPFFDSPPPTGDDSEHSLLLSLLPRPSRKKPLPDGGVHE